MLEKCQALRAEARQHAQLQRRHKRAVAALLARAVQLEEQFMQLPLPLFERPGPAGAALELPFPARGSR